jgi:hypothetical protein
MVAAAVVGSAVVGGVSSAVAGSKAAKAQKKAAEMSAETERYMYDQTRADQAPYRQVGTGALYKLADMYGVARPIDSPSSIKTPAQWFNTGFGSISIPGGGFGGDQTNTQQMTKGYKGFRTSPGYQFRVDEAMKGIERSAAARGMRLSGATMDAVQRRVQGVAEGEFENYANRLSALAGVGQTATQATSQAGAQAASGMAQAYTNAGNARASAYQNMGNAINSGVSNIAAGYLYQQGYKGGGS